MYKRQLLRSLIDVGVVHEICVALQSQVLGDGGSQSGLAVVNVTDGADVHTVSYTHLGPAHGRPDAPRP